MQDFKYIQQCVPQREYTSSFMEWNFLYTYVRTKVEMYKIIFYSFGSFAILQ